MMNEQASSIDDEDARDSRIIGRSLSVKHKAAARVGSERQ